MKRESDYFGEAEMDLLFIARRLRDALALENALTAAGVDYFVEPDLYRGGVIFQSERVGAFFYVLPDAYDFATGVMRGTGFEPFQP